ncbi:hypothetical protein D3C84_488670 [compost metagenome]
MQHSNNESSSSEYQDNADGLAGVQLATVPPSVMVTGESVIHGINIDLESKGGAVNPRLVVVRATDDRGKCLAHDVDLEGGGNSDRRVPFKPYRFCKQRLFTLLRIMLIDRDARQ